jgi:selenocysteine lyase/cysteine desulfurase
MIYLDHAATSFPKPEPVVRAVADCLRCVGGSPGRGGHAGNLEANRIVHEARRRAATLLGVGDPARIVLTSGATEGVNVALRGTLRPGDHVVTSDVEHNAVARPVAWLAARGVEVTRVRHEPDGERFVAELERARRPGTRAVVVVHASNVTGQAIDVSAGYGL